MTREVFLSELKQELFIRRCKDIDDIIAYFDEVITDGEESGQNTEDIIKRLGTPKEIAETFEQELEKEPTIRDYLKDEEKPEEETCRIFNEISSLDMDLINYDVHICQSEDNQTYIRYREGRFSHLNIDCNGGILSVEEETDHFSIFRFFNGERGGKRSLTVEVPDTVLEEFKTECVNGDISIENLRAESIGLECVNGDIVLKSIETETLEIENVNGDIRLEEVKAEEISIEDTNGDITGECIQAEDISAETVSGDIEFDINGEESSYSIKQSTISRSSHLNRRAPNSLTMETISGDIKYSFRY